MSQEETTDELGSGLSAVTFEMEQYRALRGEILRGMEDGNQVISYGLAAIGLVVTAGFSQKDNTIGFVLTVVLIPLLSSLVMSLWLGTLERIARASFFITGIEHRIKEALGVPALPTWDTWLRSKLPDVPQKSHHFWSTEYSGVGLFVCLVVLPLVLSLFTGGNEVHRVTRWVVTGVMVALEALFFYSTLRRLMRWKTWLTTVFNPCY